MIVPISQGSREYAEAVRSKIRAQRFFVDVDHGDSKMEKKIRDAQLAQYNYILVDNFPGGRDMRVTCSCTLQIMGGGSVGMTWGGCCVGGGRAGVEQEHCECAHTRQPEARRALPGCAVGCAQQGAQLKVCSCATSSHASWNLRGGEAGVAECDCCCRSLDSVFPKPTPPPEKPAANGQQ